MVYLQKPWKTLPWKKITIKFCSILKQQWWNQMNTLSWGQKISKNLIMILKEQDFSDDSDFVFLGWF